MTQFPRLFIVLCSLFTIFAFVSGCSEEEVKVGPPLVQKSPSPKPVSKTKSPSMGGPTFDLTLSSYVPAGFSLYASAGDLAFMKEHLQGGPFDKDQLHLMRASMPTTMSTGLASVITEVNEVTRSNKLTNSTILELCLDGFVFAAAPDVEKGSARFIFVANRSRDIVRLCDDLLPKLRECKKHELIGEKVDEILLHCRNSIFLLSKEKFQIVASDLDVIEGALKAAAGKVTKMSDSPLIKAVKPRLDKAAKAYLIADAPALVGHKPAYSSLPGAHIVFNPKEKLEPSALAKLGGLGLELHQGRRSIIVNAKLCAPKGSTIFNSLASFSAQENVQAPQIIGESIPFCLGTLTKVEDLLSFSPLKALPASPITSAVSNMSERAQGAAKEYSLSFEKDIKPWIGNEISLMFLWELRYPQAALLIGTKDASRCVALFNKLRETLEAKGYIFASRTVGAHRVYYTRYQGADPREFEPSITVTPNFLILATGRRAIDALLVEQEKVEGTQSFCTALEQLQGKVHYCARFSTRLLDRIIEPHEQKLTQMTPANHGLCNANLVAIEGGKAHPMLSKCPSGGTYHYDGKEAHCSVHGTISSPLIPSLELKARLSTVKYFRKRFQAVTIGAAKMADDLYQATFVFQESPPKED